MNVISSLDNYEKKSVVMENEIVEIFKIYANFILFFAKKIFSYKVFRRKYVEIVFLGILIWKNVNEFSEIGNNFFFFSEIKLFAV